MGYPVLYPIITGFKYKNRGEHAIMNCIEYKTEVKQRENGFNVEITYTWQGDPIAREAFEKEMRNYLEGGFLRDYPGVSFIGPTECLKNLE